MVSSTTPGSPGCLDITGARVVVEWTKPDGQACYLSCVDNESAEAGQITLDCHFRPSSKSASLRLRAPILLKGLGRKPAPLFVFIAPERIQSMSHASVEPTQIPDDVRKMLGGDDIASVQFTLSQRVDLVVPPHSPLVPKKKVFWDIFDALKMVAQETSFTIYLKQADLPFDDSLRLLCSAMCAGDLATSDAHADVSRLYDGKGGRLLTGAGLSVPATAPVDSPPSYDDAGPPPPAPSIEKEHAGSVDQDEAAGSSRKRQRTSSTVPDSGPPDLAIDLSRMEAVCRKLMGEMIAKRHEEDEQLRSELWHMETRIKDWVSERLSKHMDDIREEVRRTSVQQQDQVDGRVHEVRLELQEVTEEVQGVGEKAEEIQEEVQKFRDDASDLVDARLDERLECLQSELEEHIADQLHDVEERVIDRLRSSVCIDFNIFD